MREQDQNRSFAAVPDPPRPDLDPQYGRYVDTGRQGLIRRAFAVCRHLFALVVGGTTAHLGGLPRRERRRLGKLILRGICSLFALFTDRKLRREPFPVQLRCRLERLGPTYIKLGQALSIREDLLPTTVTEELAKLQDRLPAVPYAEFLELVTASLEPPIEEVFLHVRSVPLGSASIGQAHLATRHDGSQVILKVVKPGIRATLRRDTRLLSILGVVLQLFLGRYQPRRILREFRESVLREVDLTREADNAETFASAFEGDDHVVFPRIHRELSSERLLVMEYLEGIKPGDERARNLPVEDRERLVDLGAGAIIRMLYRDGFFHADLHPGNLLILPGPSGPRIGFLDLGQVGRFSTDTKRALTYYYYSVVMGDAESAAHYLTALSESDGDSDLAAFQRDVEDVCRRFTHAARFGGFSLGRLILESVSRGARHRVYFPVEMVLMVKAIVTFEAVGRLLVPKFDVAAVSRKHVHKILLDRFGPMRLAQESLTSVPELVDALAKTPRLITEGLQLVEQATRRPQENPFAGLRATLFGGACLVAGAILAGFQGPWPVWGALLLIGLLLPLRRR